MGVIGGLYSGVSYVGVNMLTSFQTIDDVLEAFTTANQSDSVVGLFVMPSTFYSTGRNPVVRTVRVAIPTKIGNYIPRNKKLLTYPFCFLNVDAQQTSKIYRYEWFNKQLVDPPNYVNNVLGFIAYCSINPNVEVGLSPVNYNGFEGVNVTEEITMGNFPQLPYAFDSYKAWLAQHGSGAILNLGVTGAGVIGGIATGNPLVAATATLGFANSVNQIAMASTKGDKIKGNQGGSNHIAGGIKEFYFMRMGVTEENALTIDSFFDFYGYTVNRRKTPNRNVRPHWTYTKTKDCVLTGNVPNDALKKICSIYNKGITFWKRGSEVGHYGLDNSPV